MVMVDGVQVTLFDGDGLLVATQVLISIATISKTPITLVSGRQRWILLGCRLFSLFTSFIHLIRPFSMHSTSRHDCWLTTGGPLLHPRLSAIVITPLACLTSKPLVGRKLFKLEQM